MPLAAWPTRMKPWGLVGEVFVKRVGLIAVEVLDNPLVSLPVLLTGFLCGFKGDLRVLLDEHDNSAASRSNSLIFSTYERMKRTPSSNAVKSCRSIPAQISSERASKFSRTASRSSRIARVRSREEDIGLRSFVFLAINTHAVLDVVINDEVKFVCGKVVL